MNKPELGQADRNGEDPERIPALQRLLDRPFILLLLGMLVMVVFYTGWGLYEIITLPESTLP